MTVTLITLLILAAPGDIDPLTGLVDAPGAAVVAANCSACHSLKLVTQNRGTRSDWVETIRWMQKTQNLWPLDPVVEGTIVEYLAKHFGPQGYARRPPLHPSLMPNSGRPPARTAAREQTKTDQRAALPSADTHASGCGCALSANPNPSGVAWMLGLFWFAVSIRRARGRGNARDTRSQRCDTASKAQRFP